MKSQNYRKLALITMLISLVFVVTNVNAKKPVDPVFTVITDPGIEPIYSYGAHNKQIVFRNAAMNLGQFTGLLDSGDDCDHGFSDGIIVLKPKYPNNPLIARLEFWFEGTLESGDPASHLFYMEGEFHDQDNWPPLVPVETTVIFDSWGVAAEKKWAQRQDCAGEYSDPSGSWTVTVTRVSD